MPELVKMENRLDRDIAADLKARISEQLEHVAAIMDEARRANMIVQFQFGIDGFGRNVVASLSVVTVLA